ncbi:hypothetical protein [Psychroflexus sediminis]|uniref:Uncharacterized protein n=1 Tax=Psychroflexus sediminis TaxID=470826 RepID=A0A1G7XDC3_9FLAO|nr:hypothetical protein [Psychroflexus sediminis]SDG82199.1 hypothetical protein SAMN04488027_10840 [Psychroflexus sediminis]
MTDREHKQLEFMNNNRSRIIKKYISNKDKEGYVRLYVDDDFNLIEESFKFVEGDFNKDSLYLYKHLNQSSLKE